MDLLIQTRTKQSSLIETLLGWRTVYRFGVVEGIILSIYCAILAFTIPFHEPWADEAQAWLIARDCTTWDIVRHRLHYEGAPALWHLTLHFAHVLGLPYSGIGYLGAAFATLGVFVMLRWSPFPLAVRILLPFTYFLAYQYAVIARGYTLFSLLVFGLCALFTTSRKPVWFAVVSGLLANLSLQGAIFSLFAVALYIVDRRSARADDSSRTPTHSRCLARVIAIYLCFLTVAGLVALPAPDVGFAVGDQVRSGLIHQALIIFPGPLPVVSNPMQTIAPPHPPIPVLSEPEPLQPSFRDEPARWAAWYVYHHEVDAQGRAKPQSFSQPLLEFILGGLGQVTWPISRSRVLACLFLLVLILWLRARTFLRALLPWACLILVGEGLWVADHHAGMLLIALLAAIWLAADVPQKALSSPRLDRAFVLLLTLICLLQIGWTFHCLREDIHGMYDPGKETAAYLQGHSNKRMVAFDYPSVSMQPYFLTNPFSNLPASFWLWSSSDNPDYHYIDTIMQHPDLVVFGSDFVDAGLMHNVWAPMSTLVPEQERRDLPHNVIIYLLRAEGYHMTHRFCGTRFSRLSSSYTTCDEIWEPIPLSPSF